MIDARAPSRRGFTLVETMTVSGCLVLLMGIGLPHVAQQNEQTKLQQCQQKIRELALGAHSFHDSNRRLPPATIGYANAVAVAEWSDNAQSGVYWKNIQNTSSLALISPYIGLHENYAIISSIAFDMYTTFPDYWQAVGSRTFNWQGDIPNIHDVSRKSVDKFLCPADNLYEQKILAVIATQPCLPYGDEKNDMATKTWPGEWAVQPKYSNYLACGGALGGQALVNPDDRKWRGAMSSRQRVFLRSIGDGLAQTFMYGETLGKIDAGKRQMAMSWMWGGMGRVRGDLPAHEQSNPTNANITALGSEKYASAVGFSSRHDHRVFFAFCDASTRSINTNVDLQVLYELAGAFDGGSPHGY